MPWGFETLHPVLQATLAGTFTWLLTALGAALVFLRRTPSQRLLDLMLGFAAGVMLAASFWSLLAPSIALSEELGQPGWLPAAIGFLAGGGALALVDRVLPHLHPFLRREQAEGIPTTWRRSTLLVLAITLHNVPEGLAVGVAYGALAHDIPGATMGGAVALTLGIALQNFPEGTAVSMPLRRDGVPARASFLAGQASALVEPVAAALGAALVLLARPLLPYALAFAAGAMVFVVIEELVPESQLSGHADLATLGTLAGFAVMMVLDVALG